MMAPNEKAARVLPTSEAAQESQLNDLDSAISARRCKAVAKLAAQLALAGREVHELAGGGFMVCKHGHAHQAADLDALESFALRVGAA